MRRRNSRFVSKTRAENKSTLYYIHNCHLMQDSCLDENDNFAAKKRRSKRDPNSNSKCRWFAITLHSFSTLRFPLPKMQSYLTNHSRSLIWLEEIVIDRLQWYRVSLPDPGKVKHGNRAYLSNCIKTNDGTLASSRTWALYSLFLTIPHIRGSLSLAHVLLADSVLIPR